ncbi:MAG: outer membrane lipoprotein carrier protein LolA [Alphaproteobacteria bacterium]|nr:outer membrane lipoprotein carrier protein LolA [Alphaproteobacteria bacterium]
MGVYILPMILARCLFALTLFFPAAAFAFEAPPLSDTDKADIARAESWLDAMRTLSANFVQIADSGATVTGTFKLSRPGKMRLVYDPPSQDFIVADGDFVNMWDSEMQQNTSIPISYSLANVILRDDIKFSGDITVTKVTRTASSLSITMVESDDPEQGAMTLMFEESPFLLRQWKVEDAEGRVTTVALQDLRSGVDFPSGTFVYRPPNFGKPGKLQ